MGLFGKRDSFSVEITSEVVTDVYITFNCLTDCDILRTGLLSIRNGAEDGNAMM